MRKKERIPRKLKKKCRKDLILSAIHLPKVRISMKGVLEYSSRKSLTELLKRSIDSANSHFENLK